MRKMGEGDIYNLHSVIAVVLLPYSAQLKRKYKDKRSTGKDIPSREKKAKRVVHTEYLNLSPLFD